MWKLPEKWSTEDNMMLRYFKSKYTLEERIIEILEDQHKKHTK